MTGRGPIIVGVVGVLGVVAVIIVMMVFLDSLQKLPEGQTTKLAIETADTFKIEGVHLIKAWRGQAEQNCLMIEYRTTKLLTSDLMNREMADISKFVFEKFGDENDRYTIRKVEVKRNLTSGSGCFKRHSTNTFDYVPPPPPSRRGGVIRPAGPIHTAAPAK